MNTPTPPVAPEVVAPVAAPSIADRLEGAAALIEERGGTSDGFVDSQNRVCVVGAFRVAAFGSPFLGSTEPESREAYRLLCAAGALPDGCDEYSGTPLNGRIFRWNDAPGRTDAERAALLRRAAALARAEVGR